MVPPEHFQAKCERSAAENATNVSNLEWPASKGTGHALVAKLVAEVEALGLNLRSRLGQVSPHQSDTEILPVKMQVRGQIRQCST
jgi:hypothetical protein